MSKLTLFESTHTLKGRYNIGNVGKKVSMNLWIYQSSFSQVMTFSRKLKLLSVIRLGTNFRTERGGWCQLHENQIWSQCDQHPFRSPSPPPMRESPIQMTYLEFADLSDAVLFDLAGHLHLTLQILHVHLQLLLGVDGRPSLLALLFKFSLHLAELRT